MRVRVHIERLLLDGVPLRPGGRAALLAAVEGELARLLADGGVGQALRVDGAVPYVAAPDVELPAGGDPARLGRAVARSLHGGIGAAGDRP